MKKRKGLDWIPLWVDKWLFGSTRIELTPAQRAVWTDLFVLSAKDEGYIRANETTPYPLKQLAGFLMISEELLTETIERCIEVGKLEKLSNGILRVINFDYFQLTERHKRRIESKKDEKADFMSEKADIESEKNKKENPKIKKTDLKDEKTDFMSEKVEKDKKADSMSEKADSMSEKADIYNIEEKRKEEKKREESPNGDSLVDSELADSKESSSSESTCVKKNFSHAFSTSKNFTSQSQPSPCTVSQKQESPDLALEDEEQQSIKTLDDYFEKRLVKRFAEQVQLPKWVKKQGFNYRSALEYIANRMKEHIVERAVKKIPQFANEKKLKVWIRDTVIELDRMIRLDGISIDSIVDVLSFVYKDDDFWWKVVLSGRSLRRNWDKIVMKMSKEESDE